MNWQTELISVYLFLDEEYHKNLWPFCQRFSNNDSPDFSDVEVLTVYFWGILKGYKQLKNIHLFTEEMLRDWFPKLPSYVSFIRRLNRMSDLFPMLIERLQARTSLTNVIPDVFMVDSFPVIMANAKRSQSAKVADHFANKGRCASKGFYFYGIKVHIIAQRRQNTMPLPTCIAISPASASDLRMLKIVLPNFRNARIFGDKVYIDAALNKQLLENQSVQLLTPVRKKKNQQTDPTLFEKLLSTSVSRVRQPIESLFNWLNEKTAIETASKIRSWNGMLVHAFGKIAVAMYIMAFNM